MSSFRRTSGVLFSHTWRNVCSWATQAVTRAGSSTTQQHKSISSQNVQNSMNASFLDLRNTRQHHPLISRPGSLSLAPVPTSVPMLDLEGDSDVEVIAPRIPHAELPLDAALPERTPTPPGSPVIVHAPLPALAHDPPVRVTLW